MIIVLVVGLVLTAIALASIARSDTDSSLVTRNREAVASDAVVDAGIARGRARLTDAFQTINANNSLRPATCTTWGLAGTSCKDNTSQAIPLILPGARSADELYCPGTSERALGVAAGGSLTVNGSTITAASRCAGSAGVPYYEFPMIVEGRTRWVRYTVEEVPAAMPGDLTRANPDNPFGIGCPQAQAVRQWCTIGTIGGVVKTFRMSASLDFLSGTTTAPWGAAEQFMVVSRSTFNSFAVLFNNDLEIAPGAPLTIGGKVQTNANLYLANDGLQLTHLYDSTDSRYDSTDSAITAVGNIALGRQVSLGGDTGTSTTPEVDNAKGNAVGLSSINNSFTQLAGFVLADLSDPSKLGVTWTNKGNYNNDSSTDYAAKTIDGRLKSQQAPVNLPQAETLDPSNSKNVFLDLINNPTSDLTSSGGLYILTKSDGSTLIKKDGSPIALIVPDSSGTTREYAVNSNGSTGSQRSNAQRYFPEGTIKQAEFYNGREGPTIANQNIKVTDIDINLMGTAKITDGAQAGQAIYPQSGLIYATRDDAIADSNPPGSNTSDPKRRPNGFRLKNGAKLPGAGLTLVTPDPAYIQGDFNRHQACPSTGGTCNPVDPNDKDYASKVSNAPDTWKTAAVLSDAISILSNAWKDTGDTGDKGKTGNANSSRTVQAASDTEVNAVLASGSTKSYTDDYSGGLENFPRLLEDWSKKTLLMRGSMIQLWYSRYATGRWKTPGYYSAAIRDWSYDTSFRKNPDPIVSERFPGIANVGGTNSANWILSRRFSFADYMRRACSTAGSNVPLGWEPTSACTGY